MIIPDTNLLLYAYDSLSVHHDPAARWWEATLSGDDAVGLTPPTLFGFVRVATNPRVYDHPLTLAAASSVVRSWLERRVTSALATPPTHVEDVLSLLAAAGSSGANLVTDAQIAAFALRHHGVIHTADHDFRRFPDLRTEFPLEEILPN